MIRFKPGVLTKLLLSLSAQLKNPEEFGWKLVSHPETNYYIEIETPNGKLVLGDTNYARTIKVGPFSYHLDKTSNYWKMEYLLPIDQNLGLKTRRHQKIAHFTGDESCPHFGTFAFFQSCANMMESYRNQQRLRGLR